MINNELIDYIKQQLKQSQSREAITNDLISHGWKQSDIDEAFNLVNFSSDKNDYYQLSYLNKPKKKFNKVFLLVVLGLLIISGGILGYFYYFKETPEEVVRKMIFSFSKIKSFEYQGEVKTKIYVPDFNNLLMQPLTFGSSFNELSNKKLSDLSLKFSGKNDSIDLNNIKSSFSMNIKTDSFKELLKGRSSISLETIFIDKTFYIKFNNLPNLGFFNLSSFSNQWIKFDIENIKKQFGFQNIEEEIKKIQEEQKLTSEQIEKIKKILYKSKLLKITENLGTEKIDEVNTYHYKFLLDKNEFNNVVKGIFEIIQNKKLTEKEVNEFYKKLEEMGNLSGEIWIGKKDYLPYKLFFIIEPPKEINKNKDTNQLEIKIDILFKNYNKPIDIKPPSSFKNIEEIFGQLFLGFFSGMNPELSPSGQYNLKLEIPLQPDQ